MQTAFKGPDVHSGAGTAPLLDSPETIALDSVLGRIGPLEVRLARDADEVAVAQEVRYRVFFEELGARHAAGAQQLEARDADRFDPICDHLLVFDTALPGPSHRQIVGTYRLLPQDRAEAAGGFYSNDEFELDALVKRHPDLRFLELGRSCVLAPYRTKRVIEVLWQGIWAYCRLNKVDVMTGCASFHGTDPAAHAEALSLLSHSFRAEGEWAVRAVASRYHSMDLMPAEKVDMRSALNQMPPLIKGYLRLGAKFGDGCVVDVDFDTTDVLVVMPVEWIAGRYLNYYGGETRLVA